MSVGHERRRVPRFVPGVNGVTARGHGSGSRRGVTAQGWRRSPSRCPPRATVAVRMLTTSPGAALQPAPGDAGGATPPPPLGPSLQDAKFRLSPSSVPAQRTTATTASGNILGSGDEP
ncbi:unnamed protein product [Lampetra planeri]